MAIIYYPNGTQIVEKLTESGSQVVEVLNVPPINAIFYFDTSASLTSASIEIPSSSFAVTASFAVSASWAPNTGGGNSTSASWSSASLSSSYAANSDTASTAVSSSYSQNATIALIAEVALLSDTASISVFSDYTISSSWASSSISSSFAQSASWAPFIDSPYASSASFASSSISSSFSQQSLNAINAVNATNANDILVTANSSNVNYDVLLTQGAGSTNPLYIDSDHFIQYNPGTDTLTVPYTTTTASNASSASNAINASTSSQIFTSSSLVNGPHYLVFIDTASRPSHMPRADGNGLLTYNPFTSVLNVPYITASIFGTASNAVSSSYTPSVSIANNSISSSYLTPGASFYFVSGSNGVAPSFIIPYDYSIGPNYLPTPNIEGKMFYDGYYHDWAHWMWYDTSSVDSTQWRIHLGKEVTVPIHNPYSVPLTRLSVVYLSGSTGGGAFGAFTADAYLAIADGTGQHFNAMGVVRSTIGSGSYGYALMRGAMNRTDTTLYGAAIGQPLYLSTTTPGGLTPVEPGQPNEVVQIGYISQLATEGSFICDIKTYPPPPNAYAGPTSNIVITNNNDGTVTVSTGSVNLFSNPQGIGLVTAYPLAQTTFTLNTGSNIDNYIVAQQSGSSTTAYYQLLTNRSSIDNITIVPIVAVNARYEGPGQWDLHEFNFGPYGLALANKENYKDAILNATQRQAGLVLFTTGSGTDFGITAGAAWYGVDLAVQGAFQSSNTASCDTYHYISSDSNQSWSFTNTIGYDNGYYNDPVSGSIPLTANSWSVNFVYRIITTNNETDVAIVLSSQQFDNELDAANNAQTPANLPTLISDFGLLVGGIVVQSGSTTPTIKSAYATNFVPAVVTQHNSLVGLQGGTGGQYYHLTSAEYTGTGTGAFVRQTGATITASGSLFGTSSWSNQSISSSFAQSTISASYAPFSDNPNATSASWASQSFSAVSASFASQSLSSSWSPVPVSASWSSASISSSFAQQTISASYAFTASYETNAIFSSSFASQSLTAISASFASSSISASYAPQVTAVASSSWSSASLSASFAQQTISASFSQQTISASFAPQVTAVASSSWASSSYFSNSASFASASISASYAPVQPSYSASAAMAIYSASLTSISSSWASSSYFSNSASFASQSLSSSFAQQTISSSFSQQTISASYAPTLTSFSASVSNAIYSASLTATSASWASQSLSASFAQQTISASFAPQVTAVVSSSFASQSLSSSYAVSASNAISASWAPSSGGSGTTLFTASTYQITASWATNVVNGASFNGTSSIFGTASWAQNAVSASYAPSTPSAFATSASWASSSLSASSVSVNSSSANVNYPILFTLSSGSQPALIDSGVSITYNPSIDTLTVPNISGSLYGTASVATFVSTSIDNGGVIFYPMLASSSVGNTGIFIDTVDMIYNQVTATTWLTQVSASGITASAVTASILHSGMSGSINFNDNNGSTPIPTGSKGTFVVGNNMLLSSYTLYCNTSGSIAVEILRSNYNTYPTFSSITNGNYVQVVSQSLTQSAIVGWSSSLFTGDILNFVVTSSNLAISNISLILQGIKYV